MQTQRSASNNRLSTSHDVGASTAHESKPPQLSIVPDNASKTPLKNRTPISREEAVRQAILRTG